MVTLLLWSKLKAQQLQGALGPTSYLLPTEGHLGGHDALSFGNERAFGAHAVLPIAIPLMALNQSPVRSH